MLIIHSHPDSLSIGSVVVFTSHESWLIMSVLHDYDREVWADESDDSWRSVQALTELTGLEIDDVVNTFGLGFVEEHGVNIGTVVDFILDPTENSDWLVAR